MKVEPTFHEKFFLFIKKLSDKNIENEIMHSTEESFRIDYFLHIVDRPLSLLKLTFERFQKYDNTF